MNFRVISLSVFVMSNLAQAGAFQSNGELSPTTYQIGGNGKTLRKVVIAAPNVCHLNGGAIPKPITLRVGAAPPSAVASCMTRTKDGALRVIGLFAASLGCPTIAQQCADLVGAYYSKKTPVAGCGGPTTKAGRAVALTLTLNAAKEITKVRPQVDGGQCVQFVMQGSYADDPNKKNGITISIGNKDTTPGLN